MTDVRRPSLALFATTLAGALALVACGDDSKEKARVEPDPTPARAARRAPPAPKLDEPMPKIQPPTPTPPPAGKANFTEARLADMSGRDVEGFRRTVVTAGKSSMVVTFEATKANEKGVKAYVVVKVEHCFMCQPMDATAWKANPNLRGDLSAVAAGDPGLVFDVHELDLGGKKGVGIYKASFVSGGGSVVSTHGYRAWFNDGANQLVIDVSPRGLFPKSKDEMLAGISRDEMAAIAKAVFAVYASDF